MGQIQTSTEVSAEHMNEKLAALESRYRQSEKKDYYQDMKKIRQLQRQQQDGKDIQTEEQISKRLEDFQNRRVNEHQVDDLQSQTISEVNKELE